MNSLRLLTAVGVLSSLIYFLCFLGKVVPFNFPGSRKCSYPHLTMSTGYVYALLLENYNIYVGYSSRPFGERILEHFDNNGAEWTKLYPAKDIIFCTIGTKDDEDTLTIKMMDTYGWWKVRGGKWCQVNMKSAPQALLDYQKQFPNLQRINSKNNFKKFSSTASNDEVCYQCGRKGHYTSQCYAKVTVNGEVLPMNKDKYGYKEEFKSTSKRSHTSPMKRNPSIAKNCCYRCGREGHFSKDCFAKTSIDGFILD